MRRKVLEYGILVAGLAVAMSGCGDKKISSADAEFASQKGREYAQKAIDARQGTMEREEAILSIRAMEERIKASGDTLSAQCFVKAAEEKLDSAGIFFED